MSGFGMLPQYLPREFVRVLAELQRGQGGADSADDGHEHSVALDATDYPHHSAAGILDRSNVRIEDFLDVCVVQHFQPAHDAAPDFLAPFARGINLQWVLAHTQVNSSATRKPTGFLARVESNSKQLVAVPCVGTLCTLHGLAACISFASFQLGASE